jgi:hypothetical protein
MKIVKSNLQEDNFYYISTGDWSTVVLSSSKEDAITEIFRDISVNPERYGALGNIFIIMDIDTAMMDLTLEDSLKFLPTEEVIALIKDADIRGLFLNKNDNAE